MSENETSKQTDSENLEFSKEIAHIEIDPNTKRPKKIPFIKIIIYFIIFIVIASVLTYFLFLVRNQNKFQKLSSEVESKLKTYPKPLPNTCGEEILMCPNGKVVEKLGLECKFDSCSETSSDMTKFWKVSNSNQKYIRSYENLDLNYKFNLVKNWDFTGLDYGFILYSPNYSCDKAEVSKTKSCDGTIIEMLTSNTTGKSNVEDWYNSQENYFKLNSDLKWPDNYKLNQTNGKETIQIENALNNLSYFFIHDNTVFALKMVSASELDYKNSLSIFNEIVSTFEFTKESKN